MEALAHLLAEEDVTLDGTFVKMPPRTVIPRPVQKPHPPLWVGGVGPGNAERAAARGLGMLCFSNNSSPEGMRESIEAYKQNIGNAKPFIEGGTNNQVAGFVNSLCSTDASDRSGSASSPR